MPVRSIKKCLLQLGVENNKLNPQAFALNISGNIIKALFEITPQIFFGEVHMAEY